MFEKASRVKMLRKSDYLARGSYPVVDQGRGRIAGYTDESSLVLCSRTPVVVFGDHTREWKFIDFPFVPGADGTQILIPRPEFDPKFVYYALSHLTLHNLGYSRHFKLLKDARLFLPSAKSEQREIARVLSCVDDVIEGTQAVIDQLRVVRQAMLAALLTQEILDQGPEVKRTSVWSVTKLRKAGRWLSGGTPSTSQPDLWRGPIPWVSPKDMKRLRISDSTAVQERRGFGLELGLSR
jgi:type I restriction enzyme S subunit